MSFCQYGVDSAGFNNEKTMPFYCHIFLDCFYMFYILLYDYNQFEINNNYTDNTNSINNDNQKNPNRKKNLLVKEMTA